MKNSEKWFEITTDEYGTSLRSSNPNPMTAEQKIRIIMALIALVACGLGVVLVWIAAKMFSFPGLMIALAAVVVTVFTVREFY